MLDEETRPPFCWCWERGMQIVPSCVRACVSWVALTSMPADAISRCPYGKANLLVNGDVLNRVLHTFHPLVPEVDILSQSPTQCSPSL